jgi:hypothetical protein
MLDLEAVEKRGAAKLPFAAISAVMGASQVAAGIDD